MQELGVALVRYYSEIVCQSKAMDDPNEFQRILQQVMSQEPKPALSMEEIHFDELAIGVFELVGSREYKNSTHISPDFW